MPHPIDETPLTLTLPVYAWAALRGAARRQAEANLRKAARRTRPLPHADSVDLNADRADTLQYAAEEIEGLLNGSTKRTD